ncbi:hypothetical protein [Demetria terragena]|uniref:hypothetical protein n=1 Tax=Demetria terragena TaxID=63959 RepID=UPI00037DE9FF|nr:hypothetical protein [Demetria terragena]
MIGWTSTASRWQAMALVGVLVAGLAPAGAALAGQGPPCGDRARGLDIDGGGTDIVLGFPSWDITSEGETMQEAGMIAVLSNVVVNGAIQPPTATTYYTAADFGIPVQTRAKFGSSVVGFSPSEPDFEGCGHLLVGAPGQDVNGVSEAGEVHLLDGWADGSLSHAWSLDQSDLPESAGPPQPSVRFGTRLGAASIHQVAVGAPGWDSRMGDEGGIATIAINDKEGTGHVSHWLPGQYGGDDLGGGPLVWAEADKGATLAAGAPLANPEGALDAGAVAFTTFTDGTPTTTWLSQDSPGAAGTAETRDNFGASIATTKDGDGREVWLIGAPGEDIGSTQSAGMVGVARGGASSGPGTPPVMTEDYLTQSTPRIAGTPETPDSFGAALALGRMNPGSRGEHLAVGASSEAIGAVNGVGVVSVNSVSVSNGSVKPTATVARVWHQGSPGVPGTLEAGDNFGATVIAQPVWVKGQLRHLGVVTSPSDDIGEFVNAGRATAGWFGDAGPKVDLIPSQLQNFAGTDMVVATYPARTTG